MNTYESKAGESPQVWEWTGPTGVKFRDIRQPSGCYYHDTTAPEVVALLEAAKASGSRVRLFFGDTKTGKSWMNEWQACGTIGQSMGPHKIPLLIASSRSLGGEAILADCIIRLIINGREHYRHPKYKEPKFTIREIKPHEMASWHRDKPARSLVSMGYTHGVDVDGENHANFKSLKQAQRWVAFMKGERMCK